MLKKTIEFIDEDGNAKSETHYFNLTKADLVKMSMREGSGFEDYLTSIIEAGDGQAIIDNFEKILRLSYGVRTGDGKFTKPVGAFDEFAATEAYSTLFMELVTDAPKSAEFIRGVMPNGLVEEAEMAEKQIGISKNLQDHLEMPDNVNLPVAPMQNPNDMSDADLLAALGGASMMTNGLTDDEIRQLKPHQLRNMPREVLKRAYWLKNQG